MAVLKFLDSCLKHPSDAVGLEAARALCGIPALPPKYLTGAVDVLKGLLRGRTWLRRYSAMRTLDKLANRYSTLVSTCNDEIENLVNDSNRSVSTAAISCLLKTGSEANVDRLVKLIYAIIGDVPDDFRVSLVGALRSLALTYEAKAGPIVALLCAMLHEAGGYEFKASAVCAVAVIATRHPALLGPAVAGLCEFVEDCDHPALAVEVLGFLGEKASALPNPARVLRCVYNRTVLESTAVRAAAVSALAKFAAALPALRPQALTLLRRVCASDSEDGVRDSAVFFAEAVESVEPEVLREIVSPTLAVDPDSLVSALEAYLASGTETIAEKPFNIKDVKSAQQQKQQQLLLTRLLEAENNGIGNNNNNNNNTCDDNNNSGDNDGTTTLYGGSACTELGTVISQFNELSELGECWKESPEAIPLTEKDTEYVVTYKKYLFGQQQQQQQQQHILLIFTVENTLASQRLTNVRVEVTPADALSEEFAVEFTAPAKGPAAYGKEPVLVPVLLAVPQDSFRAKFSSLLRFAVTEVDELTGKPTGDAEGGLEEEDEDEEEEDEYPLDDVSVTMGDFVRPFETDAFDGEWASLGGEGEYMERFALASVKTLQDAVRETLATLGMAPTNGSDKVNEKHEKRKKTAFMI